MRTPTVSFENLHDGNDRPFRFDNEMRREVNRRQPLRRRPLTEEQRLAKNAKERERKKKIRDEEKEG